MKKLYSIASILFGVACVYFIQKICFGEAREKQKIANELKKELDEIISPEIYCVVEFIKESDIINFNGHVTGSNGVFFEDKILCSGKPGDKCIVIIEYKTYREQKHAFMHDCSPTTDPIAIFDQETCEWKIRYHKKVDLL